MMYKTSWNHFKQFDFMKCVSCFLLSTENHIFCSFTNECNKSPFDTLIIVAFPFGWVGGWALSLKVRGCVTDMIPVFQASVHSLAYQFTINGPLMCLTFSNIRKKKCIFSLVFAKVSTLQMQVFFFLQIFVPKTLHFSRKIAPYSRCFWNRCRTHPPKKLSVSLPSPIPPSRKILPWELLCCKGEFPHLEL